MDPHQTQQWFEEQDRSDLSTLAGLETVPCLVLLGDPGTGKSFEIAGEAERVRALPSVRPHATLFVDLKRRSAGLIEEEVFSSGEFVGWAKGNHDLTILLDSLDECWRRVAELGPLLIAHLRSHISKTNLASLRLRLSCRAAEWQDEIESDLRRVFGEYRSGESVQVWQLAPLTIKNVRAAAHAVGIDKDRFLEEVAERDVNALAAHPITLRMLLDTAKSGRALGRDRAEIYAAGMTLLCQDAHQVPQAVPRLYTTSAERLTCAGHIAATCVLSNRYLIFGSGELMPADEMGMVVGAKLVGETAIGRGGHVKFTREALAETLQTALFDSQPTGVYTWRHQSYAEYLAARYLSDRQLSCDRLVQLLCDTSGSQLRIWPQLEETACWLGMLVPELFVRLVEDNADVFVRCDPARLDAERRMRIVAGYLDLVRRHEARIPHWSENNRMSRLAHPTLAEQLKPVIEDHSQSWLVRDLALDIVQATDLRALAPLLVAIMFDVGAVSRLRHGAGVALRSWSNDEVRALVKQGLTSAAIYDDHDDVRGCVLALLWPTHLSVDELIPLLTEPQQDNYMGSYKRFLGSDLAENAKLADLPALLRWVSTVEPDSDHIDNDPFEGACAKITLKAYQSLGDPLVRREFFSLVRSLSRRDGRLFSPDGRDFTIETPYRRLFWEDFIAGDEPVRERIVQASLRESGLIVPEDFEWALTQAGLAPVESKQRWLELAFWYFSPLTDARHLELIWPFVEEDPDVAKRVRIYTTETLIEDGEPNWRKEHFYRDEKRKAELATRKSFSAQVDEALELYVAGKPNAMWWLINRLDHPVREPDEYGSNNSERGWKRISADQRARLINAAPGYLLATEVNLTEVYDTEHTYNSYRSGVRLMVELQCAESRWLEMQPAGFWVVWTPVLFVYQDRVRYSDDEPWASLFGLAYQKASEVCVTSLERWIGGRTNRHMPLGVLSEIPVTEEPRIERALVDAAVRPGADAPPDFDLFSFLLRAGSRLALSTLQSWQVGVDGGTQTLQSTFADAVLVCHYPLEQSEAVLGRMFANVKWGEAVLGQLNSGGTLRSGWITKLPAEKIALIWEWLEANFPGDPYKDQGGCDLVTVSHEIYHLRGGLLSVLEGAGTEEAVEALGRLVRRHPETPWLGQVLAKAKYACRRREWKPPSAASTADYLRGLEQRPLCSDGDLCDALLASLRRYQDKLRQQNPITELWNEPAGPVKTWSPKDERNLSDCLARHFNDDLRSFGVTAVRESEIRQKTGAAPGDEPDIAAYAPNASGDGSTLKVIIEVKCAWNADVVTSIAAQLHDRYLRGARCGIHVTGHFTCDSWTGDDPRKKANLSGHTFAEAWQTLETERKRVLTTSQKRVEIVVLAASL